MVALRLEVLAQILRGATLGKHCFPLGANIKVHQRHVDVGQLLLHAQQPAIHLGLCPVQKTVRRWLVVEPALEGLDLVDALLVRVIAIGPPAHLQTLVLACQGHLGPVTAASACCGHCVARHTFKRRGRGGKAQVQVPLLGRELAQLTHRHGVDHAGPHSLLGSTA